MHLEADMVAAGYAAGPSPAVSALLLVVLATAFGFVFARLRLQTGSVWLAIVLHAAQPHSTGG